MSIPKFVCEFARAAGGLAETMRPLCTLRMATLLLVVLVLPTVHAIKSDKGAKANSPEESMKKSKKGQSLTMFVAAGKVNNKPATGPYTERWTSLRQGSLYNNHIDAKAGNLEIKGNIGQTVKLKAALEKAFDARCVAHYLDPTHLTWTHDVHWSAPTKISLSELKVRLVEDEKPTRKWKDDMLNKEAELQCAQQWHKASSQQQQCTVS
ncbi:unnamed protein product [Toxocara canis]|uniref:Lipocalin-like domain-containing protein n=1 Tax=Toxocara canis TaxID=6265 RepID=A0A183UMN4_TOXCA|nr:unnamed protein product [Toxocara canis]